MKHKRSRKHSHRTPTILLVALALLIPGSLSHAQQQQQQPKKAFPIEITETVSAIREVASARGSLEIEFVGQAGVYELPKDSPKNAKARAALLKALRLSLSSQKPVSLEVDAATNHIRALKKR